MCGVCGLFNHSSRQLEEREWILQRMCCSIRHRGPDGSGIWLHPSKRIGLGHRRLSVVDLSPTGAQPMASTCGRYVISFNGEIYNHAELRRELTQCGHLFRGASDTEVILAAVSEWSLASAVVRFVGMFAFALWDDVKQELTLVVDRLGEKPLYYGFCGQDLVFGSELKALKKHPHWRPTLSYAAVACYLERGYIVAPRTIFNEVRKVEPGTMVRFGPEAMSVHGWPRPFVYWSVAEALKCGLERPFPGADVEAVDMLEALLKRAVKLQMIADVPVGAFLSGGIDSSTVVALMQSGSSRRVRTFAIGFASDRFNEAGFARRVAAHLGTDHTEITIEATDALNIVPRLPQMFDEPFADSSQIPTYLVAELARRHVTVSLSGDGADELFLGYKTYQHSLRLWKNIQRFPRPAMDLTASALRSVTACKYCSSFFGGRRSSFLRKLSHVLPARSLLQLHEFLATNDTNRILSRGVASSVEPGVAQGLFTSSLQLGGGSRLAVADIRSYLPGDILVKVDRAAMAVSLETRIPFLDHRVVEFALRLPEHLKLRGTQGKWVLRQVLDRYVPRHLVERPKQGFAIPLAEWLRGPLRDWGESLLSPKALSGSEILDGVAVRKCWDEHQSGVADQQSLLWNVLTLQSWLNRSSSAAEV